MLNYLQSEFGVISTVHTVRHADQCLKDVECSNMQHIVRSETKIKQYPIYV